MHDKATTPMGKQAASHLATEINAHFTKLGAACENVSTETVERVCGLAHSVVYSRRCDDKREGGLVKPCSHICVCGQPFNSCSEAIAHINSSKTSKACLYIIHQVLYAFAFVSVGLKFPAHTSSLQVILLGLVAFASLKEQYDQPSGLLFALL